MAQSPTPPSTILDWLDGGEYRAVAARRAAQADQAHDESCSLERTAELPARGQPPQSDSDTWGPEAADAGGELASAGEVSAGQVRSALDMYRRADEARHEVGAVRWVRTRGGSLDHAVATSWPAGREGVARCGLFVGAYENRTLTVPTGLGECPTCLDLVEQCAELARAAEGPVPPGPAAAATGTAP